jgi:diketogulonate reductase-like aldo/keto reductase
MGFNGVFTGKNSPVNSLYSSPGHSESEKIFSSRVENVLSGQVSGRISNQFYSDASNSESSMGSKEPSVRNSHQKKEAPESQLIRYCMEKEDRIRNFNSKKAAKRVKGQITVAEESLSEEDFENIPEFEQSFQTMRADDEALDSYGDDQFLFV